MKAKILFIILILISFNSYAYELDRFSFLIDGLSIHSAADNMNERHNNKGVCVDSFCYMTFTNSFNKPGKALFFDFLMLNKRYVIAGIKAGFLSGYNPDPLPFWIPYLGLGYKYLWIDNIYIPNLKGDYLWIGLVRLQLIHKQW